MPGAPAAANALAADHAALLPYCPAALLLCFPATDATGAGCCYLFVTHRDKR